MILHVLDSDSKFQILFGNFESEILNFVFVLKEWHNLFVKTIDSIVLPRAIIRVDLQCAD